MSKNNLVSYIHSIDIITEIPLILALTIKYFTKIHTYLIILFYFLIFIVSYFINSEKKVKYFRNASKSIFILKLMYIFIIASFNLVNTLNILNYIIPRILKGIILNPFDMLGIGYVAFFSSILFLILKDIKICKNDLYNLFVLCLFCFICIYSSSFILFYNEIFFYWLIGLFFYLFLTTFLLVGLIDKKKDDKFKEGFFLQGISKILFVVMVMLEFHFEFILMKTGMNRFTNMFLFKPLFY
ncbi:hypothetical protein TUBRATIS_28510 [Tubulinosema ratisbonensis]|uniref:Uncharacterized protein n=1 Tax=Tubulinosema ratisbonensis TaxID=291195 RepID=A0A437AHV3_9MICR|nr:hypothetical protein TUBRATIS_28510 [Tubulinosema ratisbonensis]